MADKHTGNFQANIHDADYETAYLCKMLDNTGLINIVGRKLESLNGKWNFGVDWYDTCRRASWWKEETADEKGNLKSLDRKVIRVQVPFPAYLQEHMLYGLVRELPDKRAFTNYCY